MSDLVERLKHPALEFAPNRSADRAVLHEGMAFAVMMEAANEIERLRSLLGAVSPGQSVADIKEHLRTLKKDKQDGSRESAAG